MAPHDDDLPKGDAADLDAPPPTDVSRRDFLKTVGVAGVATTLPGSSSSAQAQTQTPTPTQAPAQTQSAQRAGAPTRAPVERPYMRIRQEVAENLIKRGIVGYADHLRVQPGESIKFMVTSEVPRYRADIVRLVHGDANPKGPGI